MFIHTDSTISSVRAVQHDRASHFICWHTICTGDPNTKWACIRAYNNDGLPAFFTEQRNKIQEPERPVMTKNFNLKKKKHILNLARYVTGGEGGAECPQMRYLSHCIGKNQRAPCPSTHRSRSSVHSFTQLNTHAHVRILIMTYYQERHETSLFLFVYFIWLKKY